MARINNLPEIIKNFAENIIKSDWQNRPYHIADHHYEWLEQWADHSLSLVLAARGHGKTETLVVLPILWIAASLEDQLIYLISSSHEQACLVLDRIKTIIARSMPFLIDKNDWSKSSIKTTTRVKIIAKGACNRIIGPHPQWIFIDDIIEDRQNIPDSEIEKWLFASVWPMLAKDAKLSMIGTFKHYGDIYHTSIERGVFHTTQHPAYKENGELLWPEYWTPELLEERKQALGNLLFAREFMLDVIDDSSSLFPMKLITECYDPEQPLIKINENELEVYVGVDPAASGSVGADYSVFFVVAYDKTTEKRTILNIIRERGLTLQQHVQILEDIEERYHPAHVKIEKNAFQRWLEQEATSNLRKLPISGHTTGKEKSDLREGVPSLRLLMERGLFVVPRGRTKHEHDEGIKEWESESCQATDAFTKELNAITWEGGKIVSVAKHDDTVMACWLCNMAIEEGRKHRGIAIAMVDTSQPRGLRGMRR